MQGEERKLESQPKASWITYFQARALKLAVILWAAELSKVHHEHLDVISCHPGLTETGIARYGGSKWWRGWAQTSIASAGSSLCLLKTHKQAAASIAYTALAPTSDEFKSGSYVEDCRVSSPSVEARDELVAAALWEATDVIISEAKKEEEVEDQGPLELEAS